MLRESTVAEVVPVEITEIGVMMDGIYLQAEGELRFARADGFGSPRELREWFGATHGLPFSGILIRWK